MRDEIEYPDDLVRWVENELDDQFFMAPSDAAATAVRETTRVVHGNPRCAESEHRTDFSDGADPFLIAAAKADGYVLVTYEVPETRQSGPGVRIKIPDVCAEMGVRCITPTEMFVELGFQAE